MYLRIWHDNSGKSKAASWYLNHIMIRDIQTDKKYFFIADKWFAVEEDDGQVVYEDQISVLIPKLCMLEVQISACFMSRYLNV